MSKNTPPDIIDRYLLRQRIARAMRERTGNAAGDTDWLMRETVADLAARLEIVERRFDQALALDDQTGAITAMLNRSPRVGCVATLMMTSGAAVEPATAASIAFADAERLPVANASVDLIVSALTLQWVNDLPGTLVQIRRALRPDGLFLAALPGGETLTELRQSFAEAELQQRGGISPRVMPFVDIRDMGALLQRAGFALPVCDNDRLNVRYSGAPALFADLKAMGATNSLAQRDRLPTTRGLLERVTAAYSARHSDPDGRVRATFDILSVSGWAPHESQQKPAARGSGTVSLAAILDKERSEDGS
ncbi:MAG: methyltransferase domain-containing protein [Alphaproteobacteria bacterium]